MRMFDCHATASEPLQPPVHVHNRRFAMVSADSPDLRQKAYRLRYQVYCHERGYESPLDYPQEMESDSFDLHSVHGLVVDQESGVAAATVRLILPADNDQEPSFPIQQICRNSLPSSIPLDRAAEISRFAVSKTMAEVLRSPAGGDVGSSVASANHLKCSLTMLLMRGIVQMSRDRGITHWFAIMEPALLRLLSRFGVSFTPIGPLVDHHGVRQPCHGDIHSVLKGMREHDAELWAFTTR